MKKLLSIFTFILFSVTLNATPVDCTVPIADSEFQAEIKKIQTHDFDEAKKEATEKLLLGKCFTSAQVKTLLENLSFEEHKLELAKKAYAHVIDKENFGIVSSIFEFDDAKDELAAFIKKN
tara:strand:- start:1380 stop:1742 length:363 start_codon:yes stop_codon:yes gene_type:complete